MANLAMTAGRLDAGGVWDLEDDEALAAARVLIEQHSSIDSQLADPFPFPVPDPSRPDAAAQHTV
jgi:hypothetical protein